MNLTPRWTVYLTSAGYKAQHWSEIGAPTAPDREICGWARQNNFSVLTNDLDFPQILAHTRANAPSVILLRGEPLTPEARGEALVKALHDYKTELTDGAILSLDWSGPPRARLLPLR